MKAIFCSPMRVGESCYSTNRVPRSGWRGRTLVHVGNSNSSNTAQKMTPVRLPAHPELTQLLHNHLSRHGTDSEGRLFRGVRSKREVEESTYHRVWCKSSPSRAHRRGVRAPLARLPCDLRHAAVSTWLNAGYRPPRLLSGQDPDRSIAARNVAELCDELGPVSGTDNR
jgi:hypothetical protein